MKAQGISIFSFTHKKRLLNRHRKKSIDRTILRFWHCEDRSQFEEGSEPEKGMNKGSNSRQKYQHFMCCYLFYIQLLRLSCLSE